MVTGAVFARTSCCSIRSSSVLSSDAKMMLFSAYLVEMLANNSFARLRTNKAVHLCAEGANERGMMKESEIENNSIRGSAHLSSHCDSRLCQ